MLPVMGILDHGAKSEQAVNVKASKSQATVHAKTKVEKVKVKAEKPKAEKVPTETKKEKKEKVVKHNKSAANKAKSKLRHMLVNKQR